MIKIGESGTMKCVVSVDVNLQVICKRGLALKQGDLVHVSMEEHLHCGAWDG